MTPRKKELYLQIIEELAKEAEEKGKWLKSRLDDTVTLSPDGLRRAALEGRYLWVNEFNWVLVDPPPSRTELDRTLLDTDGVVGIGEDTVQLDGHFTPADLSRLTNILFARNETKV